MKKSDIKILPNHFDKYIQLVDNNELLISFKQSLDFGQIVDLKLLKAKADYAYAPGKWTIKDLIQHLIDAERILSYRALRFARNDQTVLPGFDEDSFSKYTNASQRSIDDLFAELICVRNTIFFRTTGIRIALSFNYSKISVLFYVLIKSPLKVLGRRLFIFLISPPRYLFETHRFLLRVISPFKAFQGICNPKTSLIKKIKLLKC